MQVHGFNKTTLLDYPKHLASTIFLGSCNYRCPFCHNASLVLQPNSQPIIQEADILAILEKRKHMLEGVCITGGEPTIHKDLPLFIEKIKFLGLKVKLDTNGTNYSMLSNLLIDHMIDYVAMDIKNSKEHYSISTGVSESCLDSVGKSIDFLLNNHYEYEFRTTVIKELMNENDFLSIGNWIKGAKAYYLQDFKDSGDLISTGFHSYSLEELQSFVQLLRPYIPNVTIRGIN